MHIYYNTENFPVLVAHNGPWDIYRNNNGYCAAIPVDANSGHRASHFGELRNVMDLVKNGHLKLIETKATAYPVKKHRYELLDDMECVVATADRLQDLAYARALEHCRRPLFFDTVLCCCVPAPVREF